MGTRDPGGEVGPELDVCMSSTGGREPRNINELWVTQRGKEHRKGDKAERQVKIRTTHCQERQEKLCPGHSVQDQHKEHRQ